MRPLHLSLLTAALLLVAVSEARAQLPLPTDLPWNSPPRSVRFALRRLGLRESAGATATGRDSTLVFTAPVAAEARGSPPTSARGTSGTPSSPCRAIRRRCSGS